MVTFERKLMKFWIQSFLLGVPKIIVGFRSPDGILKRLENIDTASIPGTVQRKGNATWDGNMCINFAAGLLDCEFLNLVRRTPADVRYVSSEGYDYGGGGLED